jgi:hypothetical protein
MCVQRFDDSLNSAIHITYRISLRSSSLREPRDPLSKVVFKSLICKDQIFVQTEKTKQKQDVFQKGGSPTKAGEGPQERSIKPRHETHTANAVVGVP